MSSYTMELREIIEMVSQFDDTISTHDKIEKGRQFLFDFEYPIFDTKYKPLFETHFIRHFYMREIGFETEGLFKFRLETWLQINMPYFNKMFESELIKFDPLTNVDMTDTANRKNDKSQNDKRSSTQTGTTDGTSNSTNDQSTDATNSGTASGKRFERDITANTPDSRLQLTTNEGSGVLEYASKIDENSANNSEKTDNKTNSKSNAKSTDNTNVKSSNNQNDTAESKVNSIEDYLLRRTGKVGESSYSKMLGEYRQTFLRLEAQIFDEMNELFMLVY